MKDQAHRICMRVLELLKEAREERGVSAYRLAKLCGLHQTTLSVFDHQKRTPTLESLLQIALALELDLGALINRAIAEVPAGDIQDAGKKKARVKRAKA
jgi:transcriptional regulator with XRE-family HTH domain